jgi:hypothetical protein
MSWEERNGILERKNGFVAVGYDCSRCSTHWQVEMPQDDYSEERMETELCYACDLRKQLAREKWHYRHMTRTAHGIIKSMEEEMEILLHERSNHEYLLQSGSEIITQQDTTIRDLKKQLDKRTKKK